MTNTELFEQYREGHSTPEEKNEFELRLREDAGFAREFELYRTMQTDMEQWQQTETEREALKQTLQRVTGKEKEQSKVIPLRRYLWRVAAMVIVILAVWQIWPSGNGVNNEELFAQYAAGESVSASTRSSSSDSLWSRVSNFFYDKQYDKAMQPLQQLMGSGKDSLSEAVVYLGYCYTHTGQYAEAEKMFAQAGNARGETLEMLNWYKALLYLKMKKNKECSELLKLLIASGGTYSKKAKALLTELE